MLLYSKTYLWGARMQSYPNFCLKITQSNVSRLKRKRDNHITTTCVFFVLLLSICTVLNDWKKETSKLFNIFITETDGLSADQFQGIHLSDIPFVDDLLTLNIVLYEIDIMDCNIIGELARWSLQKYNNTVRLLKYNNHIYYMSNFNTVFQAFCCPNWDTFFSRAFSLERHLTTCSERIKNINPKNVHQIQETLFYKLDSFGIKYTGRQKLFTNLAKFDFELIGVQEESFKDTKTATWIGRHVPISVSISSNLAEEPVFRYNSDPHHFLFSFIGTLDGLALQSKAQMKLLFLDFETTFKSKLGSILEKLTQRHNRQENASFDMFRDICDNENCASTQFLPIPKKSIIDLQETLERYCNVLLVFGFNSAK